MPIPNLDEVAVECEACGHEWIIPKDTMEAVKKEGCPACGAVHVPDKPVKCTVAGVPLEPETTPPPPEVDEGDKTKCPGCGMEF